MASNDLIKKFSNDVYATKSYVADAMKTPMIDGIWNSILEYRSNFSKLTELKHITETEYSICLTPSINEKVNNIEKKFLRLYSQYLRLTISKSDISYKRIAYKNILEVVAKKYNLNVDEISLNRILSKNVNSISPEFMVLYNYFLALENIENNYLKDFDESIIKNFASILQGIDVNNYRNNDSIITLPKVQMNRTYLGIPFGSIQKGMDNLSPFLKNNSLSSFIKAISTFYYIYYIKPFDSFNEEIAILTLKYVLANSGIDEIGSTLDFEKLLENKEEVDTKVFDVQKNFDLTYILDYSISKTNDIIDEAFKALGNAKASEINKEIFSEETNMSSMPDLSELNKTILEKKEENTSGISFNKNIAFESLNTGLSEADAKKVEEHLIEMNPSLSHGQAYFYARHCTLGMSYTISQYKKEVGCAYETARVSMDNLASLGYYRKELFKNKFIYVPIKRK